jgi:hypothetical protein
VGAPSSFLVVLERGRALAIVEYARYPRRAVSGGEKDLRVGPYASFYAKLPDPQQPPKAEVDDLATCERLRAPEGEEIL